MLPFAVRGDQRFAYLGEGMVDLLATKLDGAGAIRAVDPRALLHFLARGGLSAADAAGPAGGEPRPSTSARATTCSARSWRPGGSSRRRRRSTAATARTAASARAAAASEADLFELVDELVRQLLASQKIAPGTRLGRIAALTTGRSTRFRAYLQGERELRAGRYFDALERFQARWMPIPPSRWRTTGWRRPPPAAPCPTPRATSRTRSHEHRARLSPHDHLVLSAQRAWLDGAVGEAESLYNTITGT